MNAAIYIATGKGVLELLLQPATSEIAISLQKESFSKAVSQLLVQMVYLKREITCKRFKRC